MKGIFLIFLLCALALCSYSQPCTLSVNITPSSPAICSLSSVTLVANASSGEPSYSYAWNTGETTASIKVNKAGIYTVSVTDRTPGCSAVVQSITISNSVAPAAPTADDATTCPGGQAALTATAPGGTYQWYDAALGGNFLASGATYVTQPLTRNKTFFVETTIDQCTSARTAVNVSVVNTLTVSGASICSGNSATLSASGAKIYRWYDAPANGRLLSSNAIFQTPVLNANTTYYVVGSGNGCTSNATPVTVIVTPTPQPPVSVDVSICAGASANLSVPLPDQGVIIDWFDVAVGGTSLISSPDYTTPPLFASKIYYAQSSSNSCVSSRTAVKVTVNGAEQAPVVASQIICSETSATLTASGSLGTYNWYGSSASQIPLATGATFQTPVLTSTTVYYVQAVNGDCISPRVAVTVAVKPGVSAPSASGQIVCYGTAASLTATSSNGTFEWYNAAAGGTLLSSGPTFITPPLTINTTYYVQTVLSGCQSSRTAVPVTVLAPLHAPIVSGATVCAGSSATLLASGSSAGFEWYDAPTGGTLLSANQAYITPPLNVTTTFYVRNTANGCAGPRTAVTVTVIPYPVAPTAAGTTICQGTGASLTATAASGTFEWYDSATGGTKLAAGATFNTPTLLKTTTYYVQNTTGQCSGPRTAVTVMVTNVPTPEFQYSSGTFCISGPNQIPAINNPPGGTFTAAPAGLVINPGTGEINVSASALGNYVVSFLSNGTCSNTSTAQIAIVNVPNAQFSYDTPFCQDGTNPLPVYSGAPNPGVFSATPTGLVFVNTSTGEIDLANSQPGSYFITNTIAANSSCPASTATSGITINRVISVNAGPNQVVATGSKVQLQGTFSGAAGITWSGGTGSFSNPSSPNAVYTPGAGETTTVLTITSKPQPGSCTAKASSVTITITNTPAAPTAAGTTVCTGNEATLVATAPGGAYQWYDAPTGGNLLSTGVAYITPPLTTTTSFYVQASTGPLVSARTRVTATVSDVPVAPVTQNAAACKGTPATLVASGSTGTYQWFDAATGGNLLSVSANFVTPPLTANTSYYVQAVVNGCTSNRAQVDVLVKPVPAITSPQTGITCSGSLFTYTITADNPANYTWGRAQVPGISNAAVSNQTAGVIAETLINTTNSPVNVSYIISPASNGCTGSPVNLIVTVYPAIIITSAKKLTICSSTASDYVIAFNLTPNSFSWSRAQVNGITNLAVSNQSAATIREVLVNTTTTPVDVHYIFSILTGGCPQTAFDLTVTVNPVVHVSSASSGTVCGGVAQNYVIQSDVPMATFNWSRAAVTGISNPAITNQSTNIINETLINTGSRAVKVTYVITPSVNGCTGSAFKYAVMVYPQSATSIANNNSPVCLNSTINLFTANVQGATFLWTGPNGFSSTLQNPTISNATKANAGIYYLTITNFGCSNTIASPEVFVDDFPKANAGANQLVCVANSSVRLNGKISGGTTTGVWSTAGTGTFSPASNILNADYIFSAADKTAGSVTLTLTSTSKDDCTIATSTTVITFQPVPEAHAGSDIEACTQDMAISLNGTATNSTSVFWTSSGTGSFSPSANTASAVYLRTADDLQQGSVTLTFHALNTICAGEESTSQINLKFVPPPTISLATEMYVIKGEPTVLTPAVTATNVHYLWSPNININNDTLKYPAVSAYDDITYTVKVTDGRGCVTEGQILLKVITELVIPNTFTPNADGINDVWDIPGLINYPAVTVDIFTRYGQKVFHSNGYGTPWNGEYNGQRMPVGVYYYIIDTKFRNERLSGYVTIIR